MSAENLFTSEHYCVLSSQTLQGVSLLKAVKQSVTSNDAFNGRVAVVFKIEHRSNKDGGGYLLTELTPAQVRVAETEIRELQAATDRYNNI